MKINKFLTSPAGQVTIIAAIGAGVVYYGQKKARDLGQAVNPTNQDNIFYSGVNSVGEKLTGNNQFDLGVWLYDKVHSNDEKSGVWAGVPIK